MRFTLPPPGVEALLLAVVLGAAVYDVRYRRIPNWLSVGGVLLGFALNSFLYQGWPGFRNSLIGFAVAFCGYLTLYALRAMGAGDVKLMAAVGAIVGGIMALILVAVRKRVKSTFWNVGYIINEMKNGRPAYVGKEELDVHHPKALGLPHGAVIAVGTLFYLALAAHYVG